LKEGSGEWQKGTIEFLPEGKTKQEMTLYSDNACTKVKGLPRKSNGEYLIDGNKILDPNSKKGNNEMKYSISGDVMSVTITEGNQSVTFKLNRVK
jgi:hypothetical protein